MANPCWGSRYSIAFTVISYKNLKPGIVLAHTVTDSGNVVPSAHF